MQIMAKINLFQKLFRISPLAISAVLGFVFLSPFITLELVNRWKFKEDFPFAVFGFTWLLQTLFIMTVVPVAKTIRLGNYSTKNLVPLVLRALALILIAHVWFGWIADQWPCFMGVPNCD